MANFLKDTESKMSRHWCRIFLDAQKIGANSWPLSSRKLWWAVTYELKVFAGHELVPTAFIENLLDGIVQDIAAWQNALSRKLADGIYLSVQSIQSALSVGRRLQLAFIALWISMLEAANVAGGVNILHICGWRRRAKRCSSFYRLSSLLLTGQLARRKHWRKVGLAVNRSRWLWNGKLVHFTGYSNDRHIILTGSSNKRIFTTKTWCPESTPKKSNSAFLFFSLNSGQQTSPKPFFWYPLSTTKVLIWIFLSNTCTLIATWCIKLRVRFRKVVSSPVLIPKSFSAVPLLLQRSGWKYHKKSCLCFVEINIIIPNAMSTTQDMRVWSC